MNDYVEREAVLKIVERRVDFSEKTKHAFQELMSLPSADVAPVRRGRWEPGNQICPVCRRDKFEGLDADIWSDWQPPFCPNCGADMRERGEQHENQT